MEIDEAGPCDFHTSQMWHVSIAECTGDALGDLERIATDFLAQCERGR